MLPEIGGVSVRGGVNGEVDEEEISSGSSVMFRPSPSWILDVSTGKLSTGQGVVERGGVARGGSGKQPNSSNVKSGTRGFAFSSPLLDCSRA